MIAFKSKFKSSLFQYFPAEFIFPQIRLHISQTGTATNEVYQFIGLSRRTCRLCINKRHIRETEQERPGTGLVTFKLRVYIFATERIRNLSWIFSQQRTICLVDFINNKFCFALITCIKSIVKSNRGLIFAPTVMSGDILILVPLFQIQSGSVLDILEYCPSEEPLRSIAMIKICSLPRAFSTS